MGILGRYIDGLDDEARDRIVTHPDPTFDGGVYLREDGCGCLVGTAEKARRATASLPTARGPDEWASPEWVMGLARPTWGVAARFPRLCRRFGAERVWRGCKLRAGADLDDKPFLTPSPTEAKVGA